MKIRYLAIILLFSVFASHAQYNVIIALAVDPGNKIDTLVNGKQTFEKYEHKLGTDNKYILVKPPFRHITFGNIRGIQTLKQAHKIGNIFVEYLNGYIKTEKIYFEIHKLLPIGAYFTGLTATDDSKRYWKKFFNLSQEWLLEKNKIKLEPTLRFPHITLLRTLLESVEAMEEINKKLDNTKPIDKRIAISHAYFNVVESNK